MDDYETELDVDKELEDEDDIWAGEESVELHGIPGGVWSDAPIDPTWERIRRQSGNPTFVVLIPAEKFEGEITGRLRTKFVRDWRFKQWGEGENSRKRWMRRSRFVAREFAVSKRLEHFLRQQVLILPSCCQWSISGWKDSLLKWNPMTIKLWWQALMFVMHFYRLSKTSQHLCICRMSRLSSTETFQDNGWELSNGFSTFKHSWKSARISSFQQSHAWPGTQNPRCHSCEWHPFCCLKSFWDDVFLKEIKRKFSISHEQLDGVGSSTKFLRRTMTEVNDGLVITPGTRIEKLVRLFEKAFGSVRAQKNTMWPIHTTAWQLTQAW